MREASDAFEMAQYRIKRAVGMIGRIGIASGVVVVGDSIAVGAAAEISVLGETPNLAARLQAIAPCNGDHRRQHPCAGRQSVQPQIDRSSHSEGHWRPCSEHVELFRAEKIDAVILPARTDADLRELGLPLGDRKKLRAAIDALATAESHGAVAVPSAPRAVAEQRHLTVMFCDIVDSTRLVANA